VLSFCRFLLMDLNAVHWRVYPDIPLILYGTDYLKKICVKCWRYPIIGNTVQWRVNRSVRYSSHVNHSRCEWILGTALKGADPGRTPSSPFKASFLLSSFCIQKEEFTLLEVTLLIHFSNVLASPWCPHSWNKYDCRPTLCLKKTVQTYFLS